MILFNLVFSPSFLEVSKTTQFGSQHFQTFSNSSKVYRNSLHLAYMVKNPEFLSKPKKSLAKKKFVVQNLWQKFLNNIWHQGIFLSVPNKISDKYMIELSYLNINKAPNNNKHLVSQFSKSLFHGSIKSSLNIDTNQYFNSFSSLHYIWSKGLKLEKNKMFNFLQGDQYQNYVKKIKTYLNQNTQMNHLPLFTVSNNLGQMVISELPNEFNVKGRVLNYSQIDTNIQHAHQAWFFTSYKDAQEYMQFINQSYNLKQSHLKIFTCNLSTFYKIVGRFNRSIDFRLIPDLQEISNLMKRYRYYKNVSFHERQIYGSMYFQGQPIYTLKNKDTYVYSPKQHKSQNYSLIFTDYETALISLKNLNKIFLNGSKLAKPELVVYNLESFIKDALKSKDHQKYPYLLVPSIHSYHFTRKQLLKKKTYLVYETLLQHVYYIKLWSKRILWSLTSKQPKEWQ